MEKTRLVKKDHHLIFREYLFAAQHFEMTYVKGMQIIPPMVLPDPAFPAVNHWYGWSRGFNLDQFEEITLRLVMEQDWEEAEYKPLSTLLQLNKPSKAKKINTPALQSIYGNLAYDVKAVDEWEAKVPHKWHPHIPYHQPKDLLVEKPTLSSLIEQHENKLPVYDEHYEKKYSIVVVRYKYKLEVRGSVHGKKVLSDCQIPYYYNETDIKYAIYDLKKDVIDHCLAEEEKHKLNKTMTKIYKDDPDPWVY